MQLLLSVNIRAALLQASLTALWHYQAVCVLCHDPCAVQYWLVVLVPMPLMMLVWAVMRWHVLWRVGWQDLLGMTHCTDIRWTPKSTLIYPAIVITVGVMAGMLGLGGGIVLVSVL